MPEKKNIILQKNLSSPLHVRSRARDTLPFFDVRKRNLFLFFFLLLSLFLFVLIGVLISVLICVLKSLAQGGGCAGVGQGCGGQNRGVPKRIFGVLK